MNDKKAILIGVVCLIALTAFVSYKAGKGDLWTYNR